MTTPDVHEIPRFDPLRNESIERTCALHETRLEYWREQLHQREEQRKREDRRERIILNGSAKVCPKR